MVSEKMVARAAYLQKMSSEEYRRIAKIRNGVEGIPSVLRRTYNVDHIPVRGYLRSKIWFALKVGAINAKRVLKGAPQAKKAACILGNIAAYLKKSQLVAKSLPLAC